MMNRYFGFRKMAALTALVAVSGFASASGNIAFQGEVTDQTCSADVDGYQNNTILLDSVTAASLATPASFSATTPFRISVSGCAPSLTASPFRVYFLSNTVNAVTGALTNTVSGGSNVELQLMSNDMAAPGSPGSAPITLTPGVAVMVGNLELPPSQTDAYTTFGVRYYADVAATVGPVESSITYVVRYE